MNNNTPALTAALALAEQGFATFPCRANKHPATPHGFKDASSDPADLRHLWRAFPGPLLGLPTGAENGFDALDIDPRHGGDEWLDANRNTLPPTRTHRTRSGGTHFLFQHHPVVRNSESKIAPGVDTRGEGGYIIWWPSFGGDVLDAAPPADWPAQLVAVLTPPPRTALPPALPPLRSDATDRARVLAFTMLTRALANVKAAPAGQRHYRLRDAALTIGGLLHLLDIDQTKAFERLVSSAQEAGAADIEAAGKTALWGLENGRARPLTLGGR
jgi:hypothetical protein